MAPGPAGSSATPFNGLQIIIQEAYTVHSQGSSLSAVHEHDCRQSTRITPVTLNDDEVPKNALATDGLCRMATQSGAATPRGMCRPRAVLRNRQLQGGALWPHFRAGWCRVAEVS